MGLKLKLRAGSASASHLPLEASFAAASTSSIALTASSSAQAPERPQWAETRRRMSVGATAARPPPAVTERRGSLDKYFYNGS
jgi:hypothetical protein